MFRPKFSKTIILLYLLGAAAISCQAQQRAKNGALPRVGAIRDYVATGLDTGCNNLYFLLPEDADSLGDPYVFLARDSGDDAWMNLNGRDVRLRQIRGRKQDKVPFRFDYRWRDVFIGVVIRNFKPRSKKEKPYDFVFEMIITLRKGSAVKTLRAVGSADC